MSKSLKQDALDYHSQGRPGKIEVVPTKPYTTQRDLTLAYSPGVAEPCLEIEKNQEDAYKYTAKGNLVAVISNGTAVLGLGDIGALASKPVMEGKGLLFKIFADIDVFDIEVDTKNIDEFVNTVKNIACTFGGINLEDIKAPECFEIERRLKEELNIINRSVKKPLSEIQINTVAGTFEMDDDPPSQIYDEYLEGTSIKPIQFYARCCKSIDEAVKEEKMERSEKKKKSTAKGRRKTNKKKTNKKKTNKKKTNKKKTNKKKQFTPLKI